MKILFPVSSGDINPMALKWFADVGQKIATQIDILNVQHSFVSFSSAYPTYAAYPEFAFSPDMSSDDRDNSSLKNAKSIAFAAQKGMKAALNPGVSVNAVFKLGEPAAVIIDVAEKGDYDLVVLRDRERTDTGRFLLGSITDRVVHHCRKAILVLK